MNKMRIPRILRAITWISIPVFVVSLGLGLWLSSKKPADLPGWLSPQLALLTSIFGTLALVSFVLLLTAYNFSFLFDWILNGLLRRYGKPASATILARHNTGISTGRVSHVWRLKLQVHAPDGTEFEAITEDVGGGGDVGNEINVRYDPLTRATATDFSWDKPRRRDRDVSF
jgi:hypothetical protein